MNSEHSAGIAPRLVLIVANAPVLLGDPDQLGGRPCHHAVIETPPLPLPALATTAATGVTPLVHGIVCAPQVDRIDLSLRPPAYADRCFPAYWTEASTAGLRTMTIDWPASDDDPAIDTNLTPNDINTALQSADIESHPYFDTTKAPAKASVERRNLGLFLSRADIAIAAAENAVQSDTPPDTIAMVIRHSTQVISAQDVARYVEPKIDAFLGSLPDSTTVLIVRKWASPESSTRALPYTLTLCGGTHRLSTIKTNVSLPSLGGASRRILNIPCPTGVEVPLWAFLNCKEDSPNRPFPIGVRPAAIDWNDLIVRAHAIEVDSVRNKTIRVLTAEIGALAVVSHTRQRWPELTRYAVSMIALRGDPADHWILIDALNRGKDQDAKAEALRNLKAAHPNHPVTKLAQCLALIGPAIDQAKVMLAEIDVDSFPIKPALGTLGRVCFRAGLEDQGRAAIQQSIHRGCASSADRVALASHFLRNNSPQDAMTALAKNGIPPGDRKWCLLRLRIVLALGKTDAAEQLAAGILQEWPDDATVLKLMSGR